MPVEPRMREKLDVEKLGESRILSFFEYILDEEIKFFMIAKGPTGTGASIHIFDEDLQRIGMPALNNRWV